MVVRDMILCEVFTSYSASYRGQRGYYTDIETGILLPTHRYFDPAMGRCLTRKNHLAR
jgi:hypothetical protein